MTTPVEEIRRAAQLMRNDPRFWSKVDIGSPDACWNWQASTRSTGYGRYWDGSRTVAAHRYAYEVLVGPIPAGLVIDHLCRVPLCCNPSHMEPVTIRENVRRGEAASVLNTGKCRNGHPYTEANTYLRPTGWVNCRVCNRAAQARYAERRRAA